MAPSVRQTPVRQPPGPGPSTQTRTPGSALPPYEPPVFSLNPEAQRALAHLIEKHNLDKLDKSYGEAQANITLVAGEINDRLTHNIKLAAQKRKKAGAEAKSSDERDSIEQSLDELKDKVERMTQRIDDHMRKLIDGQHSIQFMKDSAIATAEDARVNASTQASTQNVRSQRRSRRVGADSSEEDEDEDYPDFTPTDPSNGTQVNLTAIEAFRTKLDTEKTRYQSHSLGARYSENNDYVKFKRVVHDARDPDQETQLAHHNEWFAEDGQAPAPGITTRNNDDDDDDDDIAVSRIRISTKCPLTLQEFKAPVTSRKCPHSFESAAIMGMIDTSTLRVGGHPGGRGGGQMVGGEKAVQCPVGGCRETLRKSDLHADAVLIRQIKRLQRAKELEEEEAEDDEDRGTRRGTQRQSLIIDDEEDEDGEDVDAIIERQTQMKPEPRGTAAPQSSGDDDGDDDVVMAE